MPAQPMGTGVFNATANPNTVYYNLTGNQGVKTGTYHLILTGGSGIKTASGDFAVNGNLTVDAGVTFDHNTRNISVAGNVLNSGICSATTGDRIDRRHGTT